MESMFSRGRELSEDRMSRKRRAENHDLLVQMYAMRNGQPPNLYASTNNQQQSSPPSSPSVRASDSMPPPSNPSFPPRTSGSMPPPPSIPTFVARASGSMPPPSTSSFSARVSTSMPPPTTPSSSDSAQQTTTFSFSTTLDPETDNLTN